MKRMTDLLTVTVIITAMAMPACDPGDDLEGGNLAGGTDAGVETPDATVPKGVTFKDKALEACIRAAMSKPSGDLMPKDLRTLTNLECQRKEIASLDGLEHLTSLKDLSLWENKALSLEPIKGLTGLTSLQLGNNKIVSLEPLKGLTALTRR